MITIIAACSKNRVLGADNKLIWHLPEDLKRFKELTLGNPVVMGRKTFESIGKSLPGRLNIVLSKNKDFRADNCLIYDNIYDLLEIYEQSNLFIIGGGEIYRKFLPFAKKIELTLIDKEYEGDTFFPELTSDWVESNVEVNSNDEFEYRYITYKKKEKKMTNVLYIDNLEIPFLLRNGTHFLISKEYLDFFDFKDFSNEIYLLEKEEFKRIQFKDMKVFPFVPRFENHIEVWFTDSITSPLDKSDFREFQLQRLLGEEKKVTKKVNLHKLFIS